MCCNATYLQENHKLLEADDSSDVWLAYVDYIDEIVVDGFFNTILCTLRFMMENTDSKSTSEPFYEATLELQVLIPFLLSSFHLCQLNKHSWLKSLELQPQTTVDDLTGSQEFSDVSLGQYLVSAEGRLHDANRGRLTWLIISC